MRASDGLAVVLAAALVAVAVPDAPAHRREDYLQATRIDVGPERVSITLDLTPGIAVADSFIGAVDQDGDGALSAVEQDDYAAQVVRAVVVTLDDRPLQARLVSRSFPGLSGFRRGEGTIRLEIEATLPPVSPGPHRILFKNAHLSGHSAYLANALVPESPDVRVTRQRRDPDQTRLEIEYTLRAEPRIPPRP